MTELERDLAQVLNQHSIENRSGTPDFILAAYLVACLRSWEDATKRRDAWWSFEPKIGGIIPAVDPAERAADTTAAAPATPALEGIDQ